MITALQPRQLVWVVVALFLAGMGVVVLIGAWVSGSIDTSFGALIKAVPKAVFVGVLLAATLGSHRVINWMWTAVPALNSWVAPNLNGTYELQTSSNWALQEAMLEAVNGRPFQKPSDTSKSRVTGTLQVKLNLFRLTMTYMPSEQKSSRSRSDVLAASLHIDRRAERCELHYVYHSIVFDPKAETDAAEYYGAARFIFALGSGRPDTLHGTYWTDRSWNKGINTAGEATAKRLA